MFHTLVRPFFSSLSVIGVDLCTGEKHVLRKERVPGPLLCHTCTTPVPPSCDKIKHHYSTKHNVFVDVSIGYPSPPTRPVADPSPTTIEAPPGTNRRPSSAPDSVVAMDVLPVDNTLENGSVGDHPIEVDDELSDSWDTGSICSDDSNGALENGPEESVVPLSFTLSIPSPDDESPTDDRNDSSASPLGDQNAPNLLVYGSGSRCSHPSELP